MFKMMIELFETMNYDNGCKRYFCYANVKHCVEVRKRVRISSCIFTATRLVSTILTNQNSACISAVPLFAGYSYLTKRQRNAVKAR